MILLQIPEYSTTEVVAVVYSSITKYILIVVQFPSNIHFVKANCQISVLSPEKLLNDKRIRVYAFTFGFHREQELNIMMRELACHG